MNDYFEDLFDDAGGSSRKRVMLVDARPSFHQQMQETADVSFQGQIEFIKRSNTNNIAGAVRKEQPDVVAVEASLLDDYTDWGGLGADVRAYSYKEKYLDKAKEKGIMAYGVFNSARSQELCFAILKDDCRMVEDTEKEPAGNEAPKAQKAPAGLGTDAVRSEDPRKGHDAPEDGFGEDVPADMGSGNYDRKGTARMGQEAARGRRRPDSQARSSMGPEGDYMQGRPGSNDPYNDMGPEDGYIQGRSGNNDPYNDMGPEDGYMQGRSGMRSPYKGMGPDEDYGRGRSGMGRYDGAPGGGYYGGSRQNGYGQPAEGRGYDDYGEDGYGPDPSGMDGRRQRAYQGGRRQEGPDARDGYRDASARRQGRRDTGWPDEGGYNGRQSRTAGGYDAQDGQGGRSRRQERQERQEGAGRRAPGQEAPDRQGYRNPRPVNDGRRMGGQGSYGYQEGGGPEDDWYGPSGGRRQAPRDTYRGGRDGYQDDYDDYGRPDMEEESEPLPYVITVYSGKGGVGKTTISTSLASQLACTKLSKKPTRVLLVDSNIDAGNVLSTLRLSKEDAADGRCMTAWLRDIVSQLKRGVPEEKIIYSRGRIEEYLQVDKRTGLYVLPAPISNFDAAEFGSQEQEVMYRNLVDYGEFDFIVFDTGNTTRDSASIALRMSDTILLIMTQDINALESNMSVMHSFDQANFFSMDKVCLVVNKARKKKDVTFSSKDIVDWANAAEHLPRRSRPYTLLAEFYDSNKVRSATNNQRPLFLTDKSDEFVKSIGDVVKYVIEKRDEKNGRSVLGTRGEEEEPKKGFFARLFRRKG